MLSIDTYRVVMAEKADDKRSHSTFMDVCLTFLSHNSMTKEYYYRVVTEASN